MNNISNKKGSAIITAIGLSTILLFIIMAVHSFTSYRTQTVIQESKKVKALGLAEAGLELALSELRNCSNFETHKVKLVEKNLEWSDAQDRENTIEANSDYKFTVDSGTFGTISGTLGDGEYKVRVGNIPYKDDETTKTIDESKSYVRIESMGIYDKTVRKIIAVVNRRYPYREFLMYDGGVLSLIYGQTTGGNTNVFATGHLYGHEGIELGQISMRAHGSTGSSNGTKQKLNDISAILSGAGGIFFYSPIEANFKNRSGSELNTTITQNTTYPTNGTYSSPEAEKFGEMCKELQGTTPAIAPELNSWIKDKNSGISIPPTSPSFEQYKQSAKSKGKYYAANDSSSESCKYHIHSSWTKDGKSELDVVYLDFGSNIRESKVDVPENGIIYSEKDVVIKGNPRKDLTIVSEKNVFVAGDFNQAGNYDSSTRSGEISHRYGFPQNYDSNTNALTANDYCQDAKDLFRNDATSTGFKHHVSATVIGKERVVYDHRSPVDCCENEIVPYLKYELAKAISIDPSKADDCLSPNTVQNVTITASSTIEGFNESIASFTKDYAIGENNSKADELKEKLKSAYEENNGSFNYDALDKMTMDVWQAYVDDFNSDVKGKPSASGMETSQGVYQLLFNLRKKMGSSNNVGPLNPSNIKDTAGDYLYYPEMTTNGMFVSCGKQGNLTYCGPDVERYYDEIGRSQLTSSYVADWYSMLGLVHRVYGSETFMRLYDVHQLDLTKNNYVPPTRRKIYDDTLPMSAGNSNLEFTGFVVLSWQELSASEEEFNAF